MTLGALGAPSDSEDTGQRESKGGRGVFPNSVLCAPLYSAVHGYAIEGTALCVCACVRLIVSVIKSM